MQEFYGAVSAACFALLGLWWVVIELRHTMWLRDRAMRRTALRVSLYFLIPGTVSLLSMIDDSGAFWRVVFLSGAVVGLADAVAAARAGVPGRHRSAGLVASFIVYAAIAVVAAIPAAVAALGPTPLAVEGVLLSLLIVLGAWVAWTGLVATAEAPPDDS